MRVATLNTNKQKTSLETRTFKPHREASKDIHPSLHASENAVLMGQAAYGALTNFKKSGFEPDIILSHSGWGSSLFAKDVFPKAKLLNYYEWYYHCHGGDGEFVAQKRFDANSELRIRMKNTPILHDIAAQDWGQCPTYFQQSMIPEKFRSEISVIHDGVDTQFFTPNPDIVLNVNGKKFTKEDEIITYIARGMEDYRGFRQFMEAVSEIQKMRPKAHVMVLGQDRVAYGSQRPDGKGLKNWAFENFEYDHDRLHFFGNQPLEFLLQMIRISKVHVYLTAPFVLSWSLLETMATEALIVASDTAPVLEVIKDNHNGLLVPFFEVDKLIEKINYALDNQDALKEIRQNARKTILMSYDKNDLLPLYRDLIHKVEAGERPSTHYTYKNI
ncbi:glycosyltransferase [Temperatibacter marinus]|uniref:Glycosyltransferase n=1 Tax=Temperatibacter marinus TaxID=1456591 RepID=A0AA52EGE0_9PROT|nr:glycosyltransferase [Temperatibacter marinus]WND03193.1 glycosyltransferase [Temperatibacter marinus]